MNKLQLLSSKVCMQQTVSKSAIMGSFAKR